MNIMLLALLPAIGFLVVAFFLALPTMRHKKQI
jgi:hypothetical protein